MNNPTDACKQHCALLMADSVETEELLIKTYGLTGVNKIPVPVGFQWSREFRHEGARDIYIIRLDNEDLDWMSRFDWSGSFRNLQSGVREIYRRYFINVGDRRPEMIDMEFDVIVYGSPLVLAKLKHRGVDSTTDFQVRE